MKTDVVVRQHMENNANLLCSYVACEMRTSRARNQDRDLGRVPGDGPWCGESEGAEIEQDLAAQPWVLLGQVESAGHVAEVDLVGDDQARIDEFAASIILRDFLDANRPVNRYRPDSW